MILNGTEPVSSAFKPLKKRVQIDVGLSPPTTSRAPLQTTAPTSSTGPGRRRPNRIPAGRNRGHTGIPLFGGARLPDQSANERHFGRPPIDQCPRADPYAAALPKGLDGKPLSHPSLRLTVSLPAAIARECQTRSRQPNAPLRAGSAAVVRLEDGAAFAEIFANCRASDFLIRLTSPWQHRGYHSCHSGDLSLFFSTWETENQTKIKVHRLLVMRTTRT